MREFSFLSQNIPVISSTVWPAASRSTALACERNTHTHSEAHQIFILGLHTALLMQAVGRPITTGRRRGFVERRGGLRGGRVAGVGWTKGIAEGRMEGRRRSEGRRGGKECSTRGTR